MTVSTPTGSLYWFVGECVYTVSGQPGVVFAEVLMYGNVVSGTQFTLDMSTIRRIDVVTSSGWAI